MEKLSRILHDLDQGNINVESAKQQVLDLFAVVGRSEQLPCKHEERTMQGNGFTYVVCSKCGADL